MKRKTNDNGFSLVEMVVAMTLLSIFIPFMASMMVTATKARNTSMAISQNSTSASAISTVLENDIKRSGTFYSDYSADGKINTVRMAKTDGTCVAWRVVDGKAQRAETDGTKLTSAWTTIAWANQPVYSEKANAVGDEQLFTWIDGTNNEGRLQYKIQLGDKNGGNIVQGIIEPEVASNGKGYCW